MEKTQKINNKGVTLVALVITIIILLILAGVTISALIGDNGIITKAQQLKDRWNNVMQDEMNSLEDLTNQLDGEFADKRIPISTEEQLLKIGTGEEVSINGKVYKFETGKIYALQNDIECTGNYENVANLIKNEEIEFMGQGHQIVVTN